MPNIINTKDIVDNNEIPEFINNLNTPHELKLMSKVRFNKDSLYTIEDNEVFKTCQQLGRSFYIIAHERDFDGSPLYAITSCDKEFAIKLCEIFRITDQLQKNIALDNLFNLHLINPNGKFCNVAHLIEFEKQIEQYLLSGFSKDCFA